MIEIGCFSDISKHSMLMRIENIFENNMRFNYTYKDDCDFNSKKWEMTITQITRRICVSNGISTRFPVPRTWLHFPVFLPVRNRKTQKILRINWKKGKRIWLLLRNQTSMKSSSLTNLIWIATNHFIPLVRRSSISRRSWINIAWLSNTTVKPFLPKLIPLNWDTYFKCVLECRLCRLKLMFSIVVGIFDAAIVLPRIFIAPPPLKKKKKKQSSHLCAPARCFRISQKPQRQVQGLSPHLPHPHEQF